MPGFIENATNVTMDTLTGLVNNSNPVELMAKANVIVYGGVFYFIMVWLLWIILIMVAQRIEDSKPLPNALYASGVCSIVAFFMRAITMEIGGRTYYFLTDHQMWVFPIITIILVGIIWATKD